MSVGLIGLTNKKLLQEIQATCPNGIFSKESFLKEVKVSDTIFFVLTGEYGIGPVIGPYEVKEMSESNDYLSVVLKLYTDKSYRMPYRMEGFIVDLFYSGKAVFKDETSARLYQRELKQKEHRLFGVF